MKKGFFYRFKIGMLALALIALTTNGCAALKKDCDCPKFGQKKKPKNL